MRLRVGDEPGSEREEGESPGHERIAEPIAAEECDFKESPWIPEQERGNDEQEIATARTASPAARLNPTRPAQRQRGWDRKRRASDSTRR